MSDIKEELLEAWVGLTSILKLSRITESLSYNEAIILHIAFREYETNNKNGVAMSKVLEETNMLKSLANRTINDLINKGFVEKSKSVDDARAVIINLTDSGIEEFKKQHNRSINLVSEIIDIIGEDGADAVIKAYDKLSEREFKLWA